MRILIFGVQLGGRALGNRAPARGDVTVSVCEDFSMHNKGTAWVWAITKSHVKSAQNPRFQKLSAVKFRVLLNVGSLWYSAGHTQNSLMKSASLFFYHVKFIHDCDLKEGFTNSKITRISGKIWKTRCMCFISLNIGFFTTGSFWLVCKYVWECEFDFWRAVGLARTWKPCARPRWCDSFSLWGFFNA